MDRGERRAPDRRRAASSEASIVVIVVPPWAGVGTERILNGPRRQVRRAVRAAEKYRRAWGGPFTVPLPVQRAKETVAQASWGR